MPIRTLRSGLLAVLAAAGLLAGASQAVATQPDSPAKAAPLQSAGLRYYNTVIDQWTHYSPDWQTSSHAGTLYAGSNYFYCFTYSVTYTGNGHTSSVWLLTDDDTGHRNVWVSDVNLDTYGFLNDVRELPHC
ncbi:hypothetical protein [Streptomyces spinosirectus]